MEYKTCGELFAGIDCSIIGNPNEVVPGIAYRSDAVQPGDAFCCIVGLNVDGHSFAQDAINRGARVLIVERKVYLADATDVTEVVVKDSRKAMARLSARFYDNPSHLFSLVGITGTNGKTTTTYLVNHIAHALGNKTGLIGTVGIEIDGQHIPSSHTTPESPDLQNLFAQMRDSGCGVVSMEVSSHALDLERTWAAQFAVTAFTNLTQDHLDYHKTFEAYFEAKAKLFSRDYPAKRVINIDSAWGRELLKRASSNEDSILTTGFDCSAQIHPVDVVYGTSYTDVQLSVRGTTYQVRYPLVGRFNVENMMTAFAVALHLGYAPGAIAEAFADVSAVPGRMQRILTQHDGGISAYVDYAHTPDALEKAVASVTSLVDKGRTIVVFGCGGDRDSGKRPLMGKAALAADFAVVTSDNPRTEDPDAIIEDIVAGMNEGKDRYEVVSDRRDAIARAIALAEPGDAILIAGKGHEDYQIIGTEKHHFDDREVATEELEKVFG